MELRKMSFEEEYRHRINKAVDYIEQHPQQKLCLSELAQAAGISPFHFHRLFLLYTGEAPASYIRRRRLSQAFRDLRDRKQHQIMDVALRYGYESLSAFSRAFRTRFGFSPKDSIQHRQNSLSQWQAQKSDSEKQQWPAERIESHLGFVIVGVMEYGYEGRSFAKAAQRAYTKAIAEVDRQRLPTGHAVAIMDQDPDLEDGRVVRYFGGFILKQDSIPSVQAPLEVRSLPPGPTAVFTHRGSYKTLWQTWNQAYRNWLPLSRYDLRDAPPFEVYLVDPRQVKKEAELLTEIYIPIQERSQV
jgi:AraC-like DNA-binding protein/DNA gyrase inhibitor GyrI